MLGECLCGTVAFELSGELPQLYQCHCSLCRKVTGSAANAAMIIASERLQWLRGEDSMGRFVNATGFKSHFCARCGSPLPNLTRDDRAYWIPVGLLADDAQLELGAHLFVASRAAWDHIAASGEHFDEMPAAPILDKLLRSS